MKIVNTISVPGLKICFLFLFITSVSKSQSINETLDFSGRTTKGGKDLEGAVVTVYKGGFNEVGKVTTGRNGKFKFHLLFGYDYKVTFFSRGCVETFMFINSKNIPRDVTDISPVYEIPNVPFWDTTDSRIDKKKYENFPFTKVRWDGKKNFTDDEEYLKQFVKGVQYTDEELKKQFQEKLWKEKLEKDKRTADEKAEKEKAAKQKK